MKKDKQLRRRVLLVGNDKMGFVQGSRMRNRGYPDLKSKWMSINTQMSLPN